MRFYTKLNFLFALLLISITSCCQNSSLSSAQSEIIISSSKYIQDYHSGAERALNVVKVVYFYGNDKEPLPDYEGRLTRTLDDVSKFYKEEFEKHNIQIEGIPFEKSAGKYLFHLVKGGLPSQSYDIHSGPIIIKEINHKTGGSIDFSKDYVLIINALSYKRNDGVYVFHSPYYGSSGWGSSTSGLCQVADCELLDARWLNDSVQRMAFSEMMGTNKECGVAEFNSWYIGGIAHEMGHMFGLRHDYGHPSELTPSTISLMGEHGSRHFRDYLWKGNKTSFISSAAIFQLISHPIFTGVNRQGNKALNVSIQGLQFERAKGEVILKTQIRAGNSPYGVAALIRPISMSEYFNKSYFNVVSKDGSVEIALGSLQRGVHQLQLLFIFPNGIIWEIGKLIEVDAAGNVEDVTTAFTQVDIRKLNEKFLAQEKTEEVATKLEILQGILNPPQPVDLKKHDGVSLSLSDAEWESASVGWQKVTRNYFTIETEFNFFLENQGKLYRKGLYAHAPSRFVFNLDQKWTKFTAVVGLRDHAASQGSAQFIVLGDGKVLYESDTLRVNQSRMVNIDVRGVKQLELRAEGTEGHNFNSWSVWFDPKVER